MKVELVDDLLLVDSHQQAMQLAQILLQRMHSCNQQPCFVLAPRRCGQEELVKAFALAHQTPMQLEIYEVDDTGSCRILRKPMLSEFLPSPQDEEQETSVSIKPNDEKETPNSIKPNVKQETSGKKCPNDEQGATTSIKPNDEQGATTSIKPNEEQETPGNIKPNEERLAVLTHIPWLEDGAAQRLSAEIDALIEEGSHVLVFCPVQNDRYAKLQAKREEITARELKDAGYFTPQAYADCLKRFIGEFLPLQIRLAAVLTTILGRCTLEDLRKLDYHLPPDIPQLLEELHPLFTAVQGGRGIKAEPVALCHLEHEILQVVSEYLRSEGQQANTSVLASRITQLSIALLERSDLEGSHQILEIAEVLIKRETDKARQVSGEEDLPPVPQTVDWQVDTRDASLYSSLYSVDILKASASPLMVKLFGNLEVLQSGIPLRNRYLTRTKIRRFLAFLVLNQPRTVSRESVVEYLWPYLDPGKAQKNLYTSWFMLARGLGSERVRDCPYLLRNGEVYQLNPELISSDIQQFEELLRSVLFGRNSADDHDQRLLTLDALYQDVLAADIPGDTFLEAKMAGFRSKMVDVLLLETRRLRAIGELERALFCVQSAFELDETREDVTRELMDTQFEAGQRTLAMQTYFSCKQYLADELGILPSKRTTALYQDLLLDNCR